MKTKLNTSERALIDRRIKALTERKTELLRMKKADRAEELKEVQQTLNNLKLWKNLI